MTFQTKHCKQRKTNLRPRVREELFPAVLENPLESEMAFADGFHDGLNPTSIPDSTTSYYCPEGVLFVYPH